MSDIKIQKPEGKLGILLVGLNGAVATTFTAGLLQIRNGFGKPFGSLTQMATIRIGKRIENNFPMIKDFVPLAELEDLVVGGWDINNYDCLEAAKEARVLNEKDTESVSKELERILPMKGVFDKNYVKNIDGTHIKKGKNKYELMEQLREDIRKFKNENKLNRAVVIWTASTEIYITKNSVHQSIESFEKGMKENHPDIAPSMLYAYASLAEGIPFINGAPNLTVDIPAILELAKKNSVPVAGKDFKTGQTLIKTVLAPMFKARMLGLKGWFSTNILGNKDGLVLDEPGSSASAISF